MEVKARIPGSVVDVKVKEGDAVKVRTILCIMEAMKMEQPVACPAEGVVKKICVAPGDKVKSGEILFVIE